MKVELLVFLKKYIIWGKKGILGPKTMYPYNLDLFQGVFKNFG